jgi:hypothetical protein
MAEDLSSLERNIERELAGWADRLDVRPAEELIESVREAVRIELDERWLATQLSPAPGPAVLHRVRFAVRAELERLGARPALWWRRRISAQALGSMGAAAMLLLCVGVIWYAAGLGRPPSSGETERLVAIVPEPVTDPILAAVQSLEDDFRESVSEDDGEDLTDLVREMDRLLDERTPARKTSGPGAKRTGTLG